MGAMEIGRICIKTRGRNAGKRVAIVDLQKNFAIIDGQGIARKKCNILHLMPTAEKLDITNNTSHEEIVKLLHK